MAGSVKHLAVLINGERIGDLTQSRTGQICFTYTPEWRGRRDPTPLSLSMPTAQAEHRHRVVTSFLRGLLPDNEQVLKRWGRRYGVSPNNPFALVSKVGEDVAGAAQFVVPERIQESQQPGMVDLVAKDYIETRLRTLRVDRAAWTDIRGEFSLAGEQSKFALYRDLNGTWGVPSGRRATTHILKPSLPDLADQEINEHICLSAAGRLGIPSARSEVMVFGEEPAIVVTRYDRVVDQDGEVTRVHQEDLCQALGVPPERKYQRADGGPGAKQIVELFRERMDPAASASAIEIFIKALAFNWVMYGPDAHAKNYSLLLAGSQVRLAPVYDVASVLPYPDQFKLDRMAMAMSINGRYENGLLNEGDWRQLATSLLLDPDHVASIVRDIVVRAPDAVASAVNSDSDLVKNSRVSVSLVDGVARSSHRLSAYLGLAQVSPRHGGDASPRG